MPNPRNRVIIDTNLWVSFLLTRNFSIFSHAAEGNVHLIWCDELRNEFLRVAARPKFRKYFLLDEVEEYLFQIATVTISVEITSKVSICRDRKDNFLLALALDSKASHLITGDKDLLVLETFGGTKILTLTEFFTAGKLT